MYNDNNNSLVIVKLSGDNKIFKEILNAIINLGSIIMYIYFVNFLFSQNNYNPYIIIGIIFAWSIFPILIKLNLLLWDL